MLDVLRRHSGALAFKIHFPVQPELNSSKVLVTNFRAVRSASAFCCVQPVLILGSHRSSWMLMFRTWICLHSWIRSLFYDRYACLAFSIASVGVVVIVSSLVLVVAIVGVCVCVSAWLHFSCR